MSRIQTLYDGSQHCIATKEPQGNSVAMDCPYTGKGEELSPTNLVEAALGGCMLLSMGTLAMRNNIDIKDTKIEVKVNFADTGSMRFKDIEIAVTMPRNFSDKDRIRLERAAESCPIKHSFSKDVPISVRYHYPD